MIHVHKLNLPSLDKILREDTISMIDRSLDHPEYIHYDPCKIIRSEWLIVNEFTWDDALYFFKPKNFVGRVHTDDINLNLNVWGINWIYGGSGILNFWNPENIAPIEKKIDDQGYSIWNYPTDILPDYSYLMTPGVYLVYTRYPHQPISLGNRHCISLRCTSSYNLSWDQIVEKFKDLII